MSLLSLRHIGKTYAAPVLSGVDLAVEAGEVHALVGANGAGKSTLARIVCGITAPTEGEMHLDGQPYRPQGRRDAEAHGIYIVMQELNLIPTLTVAENLFLNRMPHRAGFVRFREMNAAAEQALEQVGLHGVAPTTPVHRLGVGRRQLVEIAAALAQRCRLLILDEPTAALTDPEIDLLFDRVGRLRSEGVGIIYVSHRMEEIRRIADRVSILRDGRWVATRSAAEIELNEMISLMVGRDVAEANAWSPRPPGELALSVDGLQCGRSVRDVSFEVRRGEILGLAGLVGSGRTETVRAIFGADRPDDGTVSVGPDRRPVRIRAPRDAVAAGIGLVPEDRKSDGLLLPLSIRLNTTLSRLREFAGPMGWVDRRRENASAESCVGQLQLQRRSLEQPVAELSGGNQQKVVIARWLLRDCDVLLFDEPTRGVDITAKYAIYDLLDDLARRGRALVVVSSDVLELMSICDRIAVMSNGHLAATFDRGEWTQDRIMAAALSGYTPGAA